MNTDSANPYRSPLMQQQVSAAQTPATYFAFTIIGVVGLLLGVLGSRWQAINFYRNFNFELPSATVMVLRPEFLVLPAILLAILLAMEYGIASQRAKRFANILISLAAILSGLFYLAALVLPFITIGTNLS